MLSSTDIMKEALLRVVLLLDVISMCTWSAPDPVLIVFGQATRLWRVLAAAVYDIYDDQEWCRSEHDISYARQVPAKQAAEASRRIMEYRKDRTLDT